jgi:hypothetical protein
MSRKKTENVYKRQIGAYVNFRFPELTRICPSLSGAPDLWGV